MKRYTKEIMNIKELSFGELQTYLKEIKEPSFRAKQIYEWVHEKHASSFDEMTNLSKSLRERLANDFTIDGPKQVVRKVSSDGSRKYLLEFPDGANVECVGMPHGGKLSICVSTQAGCGMGCAFCATGANGLNRSLTAQEMIDQAIFIQKDFGRKVTSVVFMGQGEPFNNYDNTLQALRYFNSPEGLHIGARHLTVSTCGVIPGITKFAKEPEQFTLAISLHSALQPTRNALMPGVKKWSLTHLWETMKTYTSMTGRRPTYEYAMIKGVNDTEDDIKALIEFCKGTLCHVNLIQFNEVAHSKFQPSSPEKVQEFQRRLEKYGVETTIRNSRGSDIDAACGQLKQSHSKH